ncbi:MAG: helix-turn-helix transcriptional regulator [Hyphomicrobiales bacterium]
MNTTQITLGSGQRRLIRELLARTGWTQTELAKRAGVDPSTLSRFLSETQKDQSLRASTLLRIEAAAGVPLEKVEAAEDHSTFSGLAEGEAEPLAQGHGQLLPHTDDTLALDAWVLKSRALDQMGYLPGDVLYVKLGAAPFKGNIVCAQVYDWPKRTAQTLFRLYDPPYLVAATQHVALLRPYEVDNQNVIIKGVVQHMVRKP